ncbi:CHAT domain-containing protein [Nostoc paludosum FACHB-159]|uniref:CHAT domain-containing protein n=2 Tax=Nostoc TaxID=1177 RepID=A0ABR8K476_9NOSO|nr:CHAT domain-containing protein [Nostoc sp. FACHB-857]MBD2732982.1 CHAT domain-containing protein [Nostoc paludosum FACHB-159]
MNTFEITIQRKSGDNWPVVVEHTQPGILLPLRSEGNFRLTEEDLQRLTSLSGQVRDYGTFLGKALLRDEVRDGFVRALSHNEETLRVLLFIEAADKELRTLRWERLCAPIDGDWQMLAINQRVPFSFYIPAITDRLFPPIGRRDLRALVLVASPSDSQKYKLDTFDVETTVKSVRSALGDIPTDVLAAVDGAIGLPTLDELCTHLTDRSKQYTILHFVSHGRVMDDGETLLYWSKADNTVEVVTATRLLERVRVLRGARGLPHFTFLCTCESASPDAEAGLGGLGQRLVRDLGMPAVVAMTEKVTIKTAQALTEKFYYQLRESGEVDSALHEATAALAERGDVTVPALFSRLGGRPLFSDQLDRELTNAEIEYGLEQIVKLLPERSPVLEKKFAEIAQQLKNTLGADVAALSKEALKEREQALEEINNLCEEILDINFHGLALGHQPPVYDSRCPFRGLYPFRVENREFFFGREQLISQLQQKLTEHNFLAVLGASGSGKSSVVLGGLIPLLQEKQPDLQLAYMTPSSHPIEKLQTSLSSVQGQCSILVIDQFEELFTLCADETHRVTFIEKLLSLIPFQKVIVTMRADFWGECASYRNLKDLMEVRQKLIGPMDAAELRKAMEMQAAQVGLRFEAGLSNSILDDVQGEPGAMPLLQHALLEMWKRRHGRWLRCSEYQAIGGVNMAIAQTADDFYNTLSATEQDQVKNIFIRLTRLDENAIKGEKRRDTRRRVWLDELVPAGGDLVTTKQLVQQLAGEGARLVVTSVDESTNREEVEVAHEALIRYWPRLLKWLDENRINLKLRETIRQAALDWEKQQKDENYLVHRGGRLEDAQVLAKHTSFLNQLEADYVSACMELRQRQQKEKEARRRREIRIAWGIASGALVGLIITACLGLEALDQKKQAQRTKAEALGYYSSSLFNDHQEFNALIEGIKAGNILKEQKITQPLVVTALYQAVDGVRERNSLTVHEQQVTNIVFSPDDKTIASSSNDKTVKLWNLDGKLLHTLQHQEGVTNVVFSPDGKTIASGSWDKTVKLWNLDGKLLHTLQHQEGVTNVVFSPDGNTIASSSWDKTVKLWNLDGKLLHTLQHQEGVTNVVFSPDGNTIASTSNDKTVKLWNLDGKILHTLQHEKEVTNVVFSPDSQTIASASDDHTVKLWSLEGQLVHTIEHKDSVNKVIFSRNGKILASASDDNTVKLSNLKGELLHTLNHDDEVDSVSFSPDGKILASGSWDKTVKLWDLNGKLLYTFQHEDGVENVIFSKNGKILASVSNDKTMKIWDLQPKKLNILEHEDDVKSIVFSPTDKTLASASQNTVKLWNLNGKLLRSFAHGDRVNSVVFSPNGKTLASASDDNTVKLWNLNGTLLRTFSHDDRVNSVVFSPNGKTLISASDDNTVKIWNLNSSNNKPQQTVQYQEKYQGILTFAFSPDGKTLASGSSDGTVKIGRINDKNLHSVEDRDKHQDVITSLVFSPDSKTLASSSKDKTVKIWDLNGKLLHKFTHREAVFSIAFNPIDKTLASSSWDKTIQIWDVNAKPLHTLQNQDVAMSLAFSPNGKTFAYAINKTVIFSNLDDLALDLLLVRGCDWVRGYLNNSQQVKEEDKALCDRISLNK